MAQVLDEILVDRALEGNADSCTILVTAYWDEIGKIVRRLSEHSPGVLKDHPIYGQDAEQGYSLLKDELADVFLERTIRQWNPDSEYRFPVWFRRFGYKELRKRAFKLVEDSDPRLKGLLDRETYHWRVSEPPEFTVDEHVAAERRFTQYIAGGKIRLSPSGKLYRVARHFALLADELSDNKWREILRDDEAGLIRDYIRLKSVPDAAVLWELNPDWTRRKIIRICEKAQRAIRLGVDERLGLEGLPAWPQAYREEQALYRLMCWSPMYAKGKQRTKAPDDLEAFEEYVVPASRREVTQAHRPVFVTSGRIEWGKGAARRDTDRWERLEYRKHPSDEN